MNSFQELIADDDADRIQHLYQSWFLRALQQCGAKKDQILPLLADGSPRNLTAWGDYLGDEFGVEVIYDLATGATFVWQNLPEENGAFLKRRLVARWDAPLEVIRKSSNGKTTAGVLLRYFE